MGGRSSAIYGAYKGVAVTASDATIIEPTRGIYVGSGGDIAVKFTDGGTVTLVGAVTGTILPIQVVQVLSTGTSASSLVALY